jgi:hypothetical protein
VLLNGMVRAGLMQLPELPVPRLTSAISALLLDGVLAPGRGAGAGPCAAPNGGEKRR